MARNKSLALIPNAVAARDADLLHRVLIELRSFDNLLASGSGKCYFHTKRASRQR